MNQSIVNTNNITLFVRKYPLKTAEQQSVGGKGVQDQVNSSKQVQGKENERELPLKRVKEEHKVENMSQVLPSPLVLAEKIVYQRRIPKKSSSKGHFVYSAARDEQVNTIQQKQKDKFRFSESNIIKQSSVWVKKTDLEQSEKKNDEDILKIQQSSTSNKNESQSVLQDKRQLIMDKMNKLEDEKKLVIQNNMQNPQSFENISEEDLPHSRLDSQKQRKVHVEVQYDLTKQEKLQNHKSENKKRFQEKQGRVDLVKFVQKQKEEKIGQIKNISVKEEKKITVKQVIKPVILTREQIKAKRAIEEIRKKSSKVQLLAKVICSASWDGLDLVAQSHELVQINQCTKKKESEAISKQILISNKTAEQIQKQLEQFPAMKIGDNKSETKQPIQEKIEQVVDLWHEDYEIIPQQSERVQNRNEVEKTAYIPEISFDDEVNLDFLDLSANQSEQKEEIAVEGEVEFNFLAVQQNLHQGIVCNFIAVEEAEEKEGSIYLDIQKVKGIDSQQSEIDQEKEVQSDSHQKVNGTDKIELQDDVQQQVSVESCQHEKVKIDSDQEQFSYEVPQSSLSDGKKHPESNISDLTEPETIINSAQLVQVDDTTKKVEQFQEYVDEECIQWMIPSSIYQKIIQEAAPQNSHLIKEAQEGFAFQGKSQRELAQVGAEVDSDAIAVTEAREVVEAGALSEALEEAGAGAGAEPEPELEEDAYAGAEAGTETGIKVGQKVQEEERSQAYTYSEMQEVSKCSVKNNSMNNSRDLSQSMRKSTLLDYFLQQDTQLSQSLNSSTSSILTSTASPTSFIGFVSNRIATQMYLQKIKITSKAIRQSSLFSNSPVVKK